MPNPESITFHYNRKVQLDQFEPIQHGAELTVDLEEGDDFAEVYHEYAEDLEYEVEEELARRVTNKKLGPDADDDE